MASSGLTDFTDEEDEDGEYMNFVVIDKFSEKFGPAVGSSSSFHGFVKILFQSAHVIAHTY